MSYKEVRSFNRRFYDSKKKKLSGFQNAENELENAMYPWTVGFMTRQKLHHVFHDSAEIAFSGHQNAENELEPWISRLGKIAFSGLNNEKNLLKLREVPLNSGSTLQKSHFHAPRMQKMSLHENMYPWTICLTSQQK